MDRKRPAFPALAAAGRRKMPKPVRVSKPDGLLVRRFWRPWYAKLWWTAIVAYWTAYLLQGTSASGFHIVDDTPLVLLAVPMMPWMPFMVIGVLRIARMQKSDKLADEAMGDDDEDDAPNMGALMAGTDARSLSSYYNHPASQFGRQIRAIQHH